MEPLKVYEYLTRARQRVFDWSRPLSAEQYVQKLPGWGRTLDRLLTHILSSEWYYVERLTSREIPPYETWAIREETPLAFAALEAAWTEQARRTQAALRAVRDWNEGLTYRMTTDEGRVDIVTASPADIFTQLVLHEVHHRAQAMNMLQQLGATLDDLDYNTMMYQRRPAAPGDSRA